MERGRVDSESARSYRPDIDGLRAVAVILVILFHAYRGLAPRGYMGVDVFFVISGYLISKGILRDLKSGSFSIAGFYGRRCRRIAPALILVMASVTVLAWLVLPGASFRALGEHVMAGATFTSNILLYRQAGYFDTESALKPLLHLWSLAIEEQYYLIWPIILAIAFYRKLGIGKMILALWLLSFAFHLKLAAADPRAFYLLPFRFWELLTGGGLAVIESSRRERLFLGRGSSEALSAAGLLMILASQAGFHEAKFPGWLLPMPVAGTFLLIASGPGAFLNRRLLSFRPFVLLGLISYPLYLWHWPLLSISRILEQTRTVPINPAWILFVSLFLAYLSWKWVEKPIQSALRFDRSHFFRTPKFAIGATAACFVILASAGGLISDEKVVSLDTMRSPKAELLERYASYDIRRTRPFTCFKLTETAPNDDFDEGCYRIPSGTAVTVAIVGDSYAAHLYPGLADLLRDQPRVHIAQFTLSACPPVQGAGRFFYGGARVDPGYCGRLSGFEFAKIESMKPRVVILFGNWAAYLGMKGFDQHLVATIDGLKAEGIRHVVLVGPEPAWSSSLPELLEKQYVREGKDPPLYVKIGLESGGFDANRRLRGIAEAHGAVFVSLTDALCREDGCLTRVGDDFGSDLIVYDREHLTVEGADYVASGIIGPVLKRLLGKHVELSPAHR